MDLIHKPTTKEIVVATKVCLFLLFWMIYVLKLTDWG
jgi:hypothetical protein